MLLSFTDFNLFKEMMLDYKKSRSKDNTFQGFSLCIEKADLRSNFILEVINNFYILKQMINIEFRDILI